MKLVHVRALDPTHLKALYDLLAERDPEHFISHRAMPTFDEHAAFVLSRPFLMWYLATVGGDIIGAIEVTERNEIGVTIKRALRHGGYGKRALQMFLDTHQPLPAIPAIRSGSWLANIAPANQESKGFFAGMGFVKVQETWRCDG